MRVIVDFLERRHGTGSVSVSDDDSEEDAAEVLCDNNCVR